MAEQLYTIPVNDAFDAAEKECGCPICRLYSFFEENELSIMLGGALMEPDIRKQTNKKGFCGRHAGRLLKADNRLGFSLILESHLAEIEKAISPALATPDGTAKKVASITRDCYICSRADANLERAVGSMFWLYENDGEFRAKFGRASHFCLPHYETLLTSSAKWLGKKLRTQFFGEIKAKELEYLKTLSGDVSWFCKKFDYRYDGEPWKNSKDAPERATAFLNGK